MNKKGKSKVIKEQEIVCPSGLSGIVRGVKGNEFEIFTDKRAMRDGRAADRVLSSCFKEVVEAGPYSKDENHKVDFGKVLTGDRVYALMMIRVCTYGELEEMKLRCPACPSQFMWELPLPDLHVKKFPESTIEAIASNRNSFKLEMPDGGEIRFKMLTGRDQRRMLKDIQERGESSFIDSMLRCRLLSAAGSDGSKIEVDDWLAEMGGVELQKLIDGMDKLDGGVETTVDVYCPTCSYEWEIDVPLDLDRLFAPKRPAKRGLPRVRATL